MQSNISDHDQSGLDMGFMLGNMDNFFLIVSGSIIILMQVLHQVSKDSIHFQTYNISRQALGSWRQVPSGARMSQTFSSRTLQICALVFFYQSHRFYLFSCQEDFPFFFVDLLLLLVREVHSQATHTLSLLNYQLKDMPFSSSRYLATSFYHYSYPFFCLVYLCSHMLHYSVRRDC